MANIVDFNGLQVQTVPEIITEIVDGAPGYPGMREIYGPDINVDPNSPDGQMVNIIAQAKGDVLEMAKKVYNSFDPDQANGRVLDQRVSINGVTRKAGTYTFTDVSVTTDRAVTLPGLDDNPITGAFTVSDDSGNKFSLVSTAVISASGTSVLQFRAVLIGAIQTQPNTLTTIITITLGVTSVNNPSDATSQGVNEETDFALRIRRQNSVALPSVGFFGGLLGALQNLDGVEQAVVFENITGTTDGDGIPGHSIWAVVLGGEDDAIGEVIYLKRNAGCGMKGDVSVPITQLDGTTFTVLFDRPTPEPLWISFNVEAITGVVDEDYIRTQLLAQLSYGINQSADTTTIVSLIRSISSNASVSDEGVSIDNATYVSLLAPSAKENQFQITSTRIIINGIPGS